MNFLSDIYIIQEPSWHGWYYDTTDGDREGVAFYAVLRHMIRSGRKIKYRLDNRDEVGYSMESGLKP